MAKKVNVAYENNPFMIGIEGLKLVFSNAKSVGIYSIVLTASMFVLAVVAYFVAFLVELLTTGQIGSEPTQSEFAMNVTLTEFLTGAAIWIIGFLVYLAASLLLYGPLEYAAAMVAKGKTATLKEGFKATLDNFAQYFWLYLLFIVKIFLWSLLLIVPGIIMFNRYLLSGTVFFAEGKRGNAAIKRSAELTKGAWLTTYGGAWIWNIISQGIAAVVFWPASVAVLYRQLSATTDAGEAKPPAHILSWLVLLVPIALAILYILFLVVLFALIAAAPTAP